MRAVVIGIAIGLLLAAFIVWVVPAQAEVFVKLRLVPDARSVYIDGKGMGYTQGIRKKIAKWERINAEIGDQS